MLFYRIIHLWISWRTLRIEKDFGDRNILQCDDFIYIWVHIAMDKLQEFHCLRFYLVSEWIFTVMRMANRNRYHGQLVWNVRPWFYSRRLVIMPVCWEYNGGTYGQCISDYWF